MRLHRNCVTDPLARQWWREYRDVLDGGNPLGISFVEFVASRVRSVNPMPVIIMDAGHSSNGMPWYFASCGHAHPWGAACADVANHQ